MHIPKTAGTTFNAFLGQQFPLAEIADGGVFGKRSLYVKKIDFEDRLDELKRFSLFRGHYGFDVCNAFIPDYTTLTILRDPLKRVISYYNDWCSKSEESLQNASPLAKSLASLAKQLPFQKFFQARHPLVQPLFHNGQARLMAHSFDSKFEGKQLQNLAISNLNKINYVGITEAFDLFLWLLCERFGWHYSPQFQSLNAARHSLRLEDLDEATLAMVTAKNEADLALYECAKERALATANQAVKASSRCKKHLDCRGQSAIKITMADAIPGTGWHVLEGVGSDRLWRWTGPNREATLFLSLDQRHYDLSIRVISVIDISILYESKIRINGMQIPTTIHTFADTFLIRGSITEALLSNDYPVQLTIAVPRTMAPTDIDPTIADARQKGLAIQEIMLSTLGPSQGE